MRHFCRNLAYRGNGKAPPPLPIQHECHEPIQQKELLHAGAGHAGRVPEIHQLGTDDDLHLQDLHLSQISDQPGYVLQLVGHSAQKRVREAEEGRRGAIRQNGQSEPETGILPFGIVKSVRHASDKDNRIPGGERTTGGGKDRNPRRAKQIPL